MSHARRLRELKQANLADRADGPAHVADKPARRAPITPAMMRLSPAKRHKAMHAAGLMLASAKTGVAADRPDESDNSPETAAYSLLRSMFGEHRRQLSDTQSIEKRIELKRELIAEYTDHIDTVLLTAMETNTAQQDEIFVQLMMWHLDCGLYSRGLEMAEHVLEYGLKLPVHFKRNPASLVTELVADNALNDIALERDFDIDVLRRVEELVSGHDMHDVVAAKLHKAYGLLHLKAGKAENASPSLTDTARTSYEAAKTHFLRALELDKNSTVKTHLRDIDRALKADT